MNYITTGLDIQNVSAKNCKCFLTHTLSVCLGAQKNCLIETVLLNTHNIYFGCEITKIVFHITLLSGDLIIEKSVHVDKNCYQFISGGIKHSLHFM